MQYYYLNKKSKSFKEAYRKLELKHRRTYHLKSKNEKILQTPSLAFHQSTYEATRGPQWTEQIIARRARNDRAEAVLLRGFEGLDYYHELPADVVVAVEKEKGPTKRAAAAAARVEAAATERRREEEAAVAREREAERGPEGKEEGEVGGNEAAHTDADESVNAAAETSLDAGDQGKEDQADAMQVDDTQDAADEAAELPDVVGVVGGGGEEVDEAAHRDGEGFEKHETDRGGAEAAADVVAMEIEDSLVEEAHNRAHSEDRGRGQVTEASSRRVHYQGGEEQVEEEDEEIYAAKKTDVHEDKPEESVREEGDTQGASDAFLETEPDA